MLAAAASILAMVWRSDEDCLWRAQAFCAAISSLSPTSPPASSVVEGSRQLAIPSFAALAVPAAAAAVHRRTAQNEGEHDTRHDVLPSLFADGHYAVWQGRAPIRHGRRVEGMAVRTCPRSCGDTSFANSLR